MAENLELIYERDAWRRRRIQAYEERRGRTTWRPRYETKRGFKPRVIGRRLLHPGIGLALEVISAEEDPWLWLEAPPAPAPEPLPVAVALPHKAVVRGRVSRLEFPLERPSPILKRDPVALDLPAVRVAGPSVERGPEERLSLGIGANPAGATVSYRRSKLRGTRQRRRDRKSREWRLYRAAIAFINRTYGRFSEYLDAYEAFMWNVYVDGIPLARHDRPLEAFMSGRATVDLEGMATDLLMNEIVDKVIGQANRRVGKFSREWGTNISLGI